MYNTFKTIKNHNKKISNAMGEEFLEIDLSEREKGLIGTLDIRHYPHNPSIEKVGDYILTMLTSDYFYDAIVLMGLNGVDPFDISEYVNNNPKWQDECDGYFFIDITKQFYKRWIS